MSEARRRVDAAGGVLRLADHLDLRHRLAQLVASGELVRVLPGVVIDPRLRAHPLAHAQAAQLWRQSTCFLGRAAAALSWWPTAPLTTVHLDPGRTTIDRPSPLMRAQAKLTGQKQTDRGWWVQPPSTSALWAAALGDDLLATQGFRTGQFTPADLRALALRYGGRGTVMMAAARRLRSNPWSVAEVDLHQLLRRAGIRGWLGNPLVIIDGRRYYPDVCFPDAKVTIEVESDQFHTNPRDAEAFMRRRNRFVIDGWRVLQVRPARLRSAPGSLLEELAALLWQHHWNLPALGNLPAQAFTPVA